MTGIAAGGVWIVYGYGNGLYVRAIFADELEARRYCDDGYNYDYVKFVQFGEEIK